MKGPNEVDVVIYVDGEKKEFELSLHQSVQSVISKVVAQMGLNRPQTDYDLRWFESGGELDRDSSLESSGVTSGSVLVLGPKAGIGG